MSKNLPTYRSPFNQFSHMRQLLGPEFTEVVGPNNDTQYSLAWLDLGTEPIVLSVPDIPSKRYSISDRTAGFEVGKDGSATIYLQHKSPCPEMEANWLPAPDGPFALALRIYWPRQEVLDGKWGPSAIMKT